MREARPGEEEEAVEEDREAGSLGVREPRLVGPIMGWLVGMGDWADAPHELEPKLASKLTSEEPELAEYSREERLLDMQEEADAATRGRWWVWQCFSILS